MKKLYYICFVAFCMIGFIKNVDAVAKCKYTWYYNDHTPATIVLSEKEKGSGILENLNYSGLPSSTSITLMSQLKLRSSKSECPKISVYHGAIKGVEIFHDYSTCKSLKEGKFSGNPENCSENLEGTLDTSEQTSSNFAEEDQFSIDSETDDSCVYVRTWKYSINNNQHSNEHRINIKKKRNKNISASCETKQIVGITCKVSKIEDEIKKNFYNNDKFICPPYIYVEQLSHIEKDGTEYNYKIKGTGVKEDTDESVVEVTPGKGYTGDDDWLPEPTEAPTKEECEANPDLPGCAKNRCEVINTTGEVFKIIKQILGYIQVGSIFAVLIFCVLDLGGAVASSDDEAFRKARNKVFKRIIALILIFLVPLLVNFVINLVNLGACKEEDYDFIGNLFD